MATAFIIRPFGIKKGIDFDAVERELIGPALAGHRLVGRTTGDSLRQGNIRTEMFQRLLTADVVVVDISLANANVFYELGIRHALRGKRTFLLRAASLTLPPDEVPFDVRTDRYLSYDAQQPAAALPQLQAALRETLLSEDQDSPVFQLLPGLTEQNKSHFLVVPTEFREEVQRAMSQDRARYQWGDLKLLQTELEGLEWQLEGLRIVGEAQFRKNAYQDACETWEAVRDAVPDDKEATLWLGSVYQRLGRLADSDIVLQRLVGSPRATPREGAEVFSLLGRNAKEQWKASWQPLAPAAQPAAALRSPFLAAAYEMYLAGFQQDLNHYYSGINALGLLSTQLALAASLPEVWQEGFADEDEGTRQLARRQQELAKLRGTVAMALEAAEARRQRAGQADNWLSISLADLACLTSTRPAFVGAQYRKALASAQDFDRETVRRQLLLYQQLGVLPANVEEALRTLAPPPAGDGLGAEPPHVLLFTGHRIDAPGRATPRFPADKEPVARQALLDAVRRELALASGPVIGLAGGASGGDILFHEVCAEVGIETRLLLVMPREDYVCASVQDSGPEWVERFNALYDRLPHRVLSPSPELPRWLQRKPNYDIWQRNNLWNLYTGLALGSRYVTLIALWDGEPGGDGPGGTQDMLNKTRESGAKTIILHTKKLFGQG